MVPGGLTNETRIQPCGKGLILPLIWGSFRIVMERNARAHTQKPTRMNPFFGEAGYRKLTRAQELANLFCHSRTAPAAQSPRTLHPESWVGRFTSPTLAFLVVNQL